ncbi:MAG: histidine kinase [Treponema sp.]|nr:histidine kinase [Treponema sp.]
MQKEKIFLFNSFIKVPLRKSLRSLFSFAFLIPVLIISIIFVCFLYTTLKNWEIQKVEESLIQAEKSISETLDTVKNFSDRIYVNRQLQNVLQKNYKNSLECYYDYTNISFLDDFLRSYKEVAGYRIYTENHSLLDNSYIIKTTDMIENEFWYRRALSLNGQSFWEYKIDSITKKSYLSLIRSIGNDSEYKSVLVINVSPEQIAKILKNQVYETAIAYHNQIIFSSEDSLSYAETQALRNEIVFQRGRKEKTAPLYWKNHRARLLINEFSPDLDSNFTFTLMYIIPSTELTSATRKIIISTASIIIIFIILTIIVLRVYSLYIDTRVRKVRDEIQNVVENNFNIPDTIGGMDEFEQIYHSLYLMSNNVKYLIDQVYTHRLEKERIASRTNEIRYKMLATQINPHFLFNTLETIRMKSLAAGEKDISTMLKLLASLLRYNLNVSGKPVPLYNELDAIQNYLNIQHFRFGSRISYDIITLCDVQKISILPLLIQPLVENSFSHGLEGKVSGGFIYILISEEIPEYGPKLLNISVKDNGCGIPKEKLLEINNALENKISDDYETSIGLMNVNSRIKIYYGDSYGMTITSEEGLGTEVKLTFPLIGAKEAPRIG